MSSKRTGLTDYTSSFAEWDTRASVRAKPRRQIGQDLEAGFLCFPAELAPVIHQPAVQALGPEITRQILTHYLFSYLNFTDRLEHEAVNQTSRRIATAAAGLTVPRKMREDAYKIYCDEAYHSLFSADLMFQIENATGFVFESAPGPPALECFHSVCANADPEMRAWYELFFVVVSETLISGSLAQIPKVSNVLPAVRLLVADHAEDEGRHHAFFARLCQMAWPQVPASLRTELGLVLPQFILRFLEPNRESLRCFLSRHLPPVQVQDVLEAAYPADVVVENARSASKVTLRIFEKTGIFEDVYVAEEFSKQRLLPTRQ